MNLIERLREARYIESLEHYEAAHKEKIDRLTAEKDTWDGHKACKLLRSDLADLLADNERLQARVETLEDKLSNVRNESQDIIDNYKWRSNEWKIGKNIKKLAATDEIERLHDAAAEMRERYSAKCDEIERLRAIINQAKRIEELETAIKQMTALNLANSELIDELEAMLDQQALGPTLSKWQGVRAENERLTAELKATQENEQHLADANKPLLADNYRLQARVEKLEGAIRLVIHHEFKGVDSKDDPEGVRVLLNLAATEQGDSDKDSKEGEVK